MFARQFQRQLQMKSINSSRLSQFRSASFLPDFKGVSTETTLGDVWGRLYTNYRYRLVWPIVGWVGFLYLTLWEDYTPKAKKAEQKARLDFLQSLEYSDE